MHDSILSERAEQLDIEDPQWRGISQCDIETGNETLHRSDPAQELIYNSKRFRASIMLRTASALKCIGVRQAPQNAHMEVSFEKMRRRADEMKAGLNYNPGYW